MYLYMNMKKYICIKLVEINSTVYKISNLLTNITDDICNLAVTCTLFTNKMPRTKRLAYGHCSKTLVYLLFAQGVIHLYKCDLSVCGSK